MSEEYLLRVGIINSTCSCSLKSVRIWNHSGPYFSAFGLNTEMYGVSLRIQSECGPE